MLDKIKAYFRSYCLMMGTMSIPALVIDLIWENSDSRFFWLVFVFSAIVPILDVIYESINFFREKIILRRIVFFIIIVAVLMIFSWNLGIIDTVPMLLIGIGCCSVVGIPAMVLLGIQDKKRAEELNAKLQEYKNRTIKQNIDNKTA
ncbi:MAG: hypothetical protein E7481_06275 [Ruminococcaceae bacterium]|nr:hypothetical protein [Oscillospiraceae bacterium]